MKYDLILKGTVGYWNFNSGQVDSLLAEKEGQEVHILIDSLGGSLPEGLSIQSAFRNHGNVHVHLRGMNASAATVASMGARRITMDRSAMYLVHKASYLVFEWDLLNADDLKAKAEEYMKQASDLEKMDLTIATLYAGRCKRDYKDLLALMKEDKWLTSEEAVSYGFVDGITDEGKPVRLTASVATAMATVGMPVPANLPVEADSLLVRLERLLQRILNRSAGVPGDTSAPGDTTNPKPNTMKKLYQMIAAVLMMEQAEFEADPDGFFRFDEGQMDTLEKDLQAKTGRIAALETTVSEKDAALAERDATIAALQAQPEPEHESVRADGQDTPKDEFAEYAESVAEARKMSGMLN